ncbi:ankyrin 3, node of Ranvier (ankyrin G) [Nesidiocoris tenuis]|uniref:Ankyrin 3, node of Ranvier (Ankyrin G) n=1 Tax=Nesidiocoris tenuis TaxID=355587 RepID=A0ABN7A511_9HEMI|nr:ankyrin 3, node of Ranvier (ankyrin G) [Nesidiocoris tenuis]
MQMNCVFPHGTVATASPQDDDDSLDTDGFQEQFPLETPTPIEEGRGLGPTPPYQPPSVGAHQRESTLLQHRTRPGALHLFPVVQSSPEDEKGVKDSKYREHPKFGDVEKSKDVKRLSGGVGDEEEKEKRVNWKSPEPKEQSKPEDTHSDRGTSPLSQRPDAPDETAGGVAGPGAPGGAPTIELIIGRKEVRTNEASATSESKLTVYTAHDVEISIRSQSHISLTTTKRDLAGKKTSHTVDFDSKIDTSKDEAFEDYIIAPEKKERKKEDNVIFSSRKSIYTYDSQTSPYESPDTEYSVSHHISDTGISLTRGTITETSIAQQPGSSGVKITSDTLVMSEIEEAELTDAGLSPIQDDVIPAEMQFTDEEVKKKGQILLDKASSPLGIETESVALSPLEIGVAEISVSTDSLVHTCETGVSPIRSEDLTCVVEKESSIHEGDLEDEEPSTGDVKALVKKIEEHSQKIESPIKVARKEAPEPKTVDKTGKDSSHVTPTHTKQVVGSKIKELQKVFTQPSKDDKDYESFSSEKSFLIQEQENITIESQLTELLELEKGILSKLSQDAVDDETDSTAHSLESKPDYSDILDEPDRVHPKPTKLSLEEIFIKTESVHDVEGLRPVVDIMKKVDVDTPREKSDPDTSPSKKKLAKEIKEMVDLEFDEMERRICRSKLDVDDDFAGVCEVEEEPCVKKIVGLSREKGEVATPSEHDVKKLMSEVKGLTSQIKQEVKELKPDLTPTPEGKELSLGQSFSLDDSISEEDSRLEGESTHPNKRDETDEMPTGRTTQSSQDRLESTTVTVSKKLEDKIQHQELVSEKLIEETHVQKKDTVRTEKATITMEKAGIVEVRTIEKADFETEMKESFRQEIEKTASSTVQKSTQATDDHDYSEKHEFEAKEVLIYDKETVKEKKEEISLQGDEVHSHLASKLSETFVEKEEFGDISVKAQLDELLNLEKKLLSTITEPGHERESLGPDSLIDDSLERIQQGSSMEQEYDEQKKIKTETIRGVDIQKEEVSEKAEAQTTAAALTAVTKTEVIIKEKQTAAESTKIADSAETGDAVSLGSKILEETQKERGISKSPTETLPSGAIAQQTHEISSKITLEVRKTGVEESVHTTEKLVDEAVQLELAPTHQSIEEDKKFDSIPRTSGDHAEAEDVTAGKKVIDSIELLLSETRNLLDDKDKLDTTKSEEQTLKSQKPKESPAGKEVGESEGGVKESVSPIGAGSALVEEQTEAASTEDIAHYKVDSQIHEDESSPPTDSPSDSTSAPTVVSKSISEVAEVMEQALNEADVKIPPKEEAIKEVAIASEDEVQLQPQDKLEIKGHPDRMAKDKTQDEMAGAITMTMRSPEPTDVSKEGKIDELSTAEAEHKPISPKDSTIKEECPSVTLSLQDKMVVKPEEGQDLRDEEKVSDSKSQPCQKPTIPSEPLEQQKIVKSAEESDEHQASEEMEQIEAPLLEPEKESKEVGQYASTQSLIEESEADIPTEKETSPPLQEVVQNLDTQQDEKPRQTHQKTKQTEDQALQEDVDPVTVRPVDEISELDQVMEEEIASKDLQNTAKETPILHEPQEKVIMKDVKGEVGTHSHVIETDGEKSNDIIISNADKLTTEIVEQQKSLEEEPLEPKPLREISDVTPGSDKTQEKKSELKEKKVIGEDIGEAESADSTVSALRIFEMHEGDSQIAKLEQKEFKTIVDSEVERQVQFISTETKVLFDTLETPEQITKFDEVTKVEKSSIVTSGQERMESKFSSRITKDTKWDESTMGRLSEIENKDKLVEIIKHKDSISSSTQIISSCEKGEFESPHILHDEEVEGRVESELHDETTIDDNVSAQEDSAMKGEREQAIKTDIEQTEKTCLEQKDKIFGQREYSESMVVSSVAKREEIESITIEKISAQTISKMNFGTGIRHESNFIQTGEQNVRDVKVPDMVGLQNEEREEGITKSETEDVAREGETEEQDETELDEEPTKTTISKITVKEKIESVANETKFLETEVLKVIEVETHSKIQEHEPGDSKKPLPEEKSRITENTIQPAKTAETLTLEEAAKNEEPRLEEIEIKDKLEPGSGVDVPIDLKKLDLLKPEVKPRTTEEPVAREDEKEGQVQTEQDEEPTKTAIGKIPVEKKIQSVTAETKSPETETSKVIEVETHSKLQEHESEDSKEPLPQEKSEIPEDTIQPAKTAETLTHEEAAEDKEPGSEQVETEDKLEPESKVDTQKDLKEQDELKPEVEPQTTEKPVAREDEKEEQVRTEQDEEPTKTAIGKIPVEKKIESVTAETKSIETEISKVIEVETQSKMEEHKIEDSKEPLPQEKSKIPEGTIQPAKTAETLTLEEAAEDKEPGLEQIDTKDKLEPESKVDVPRDLKKQDQLKSELKSQTTEEPMVRKDETEEHDETALDKEPSKTTITSIKVKEKMETVTAETKSLENGISKVIEVETHSKLQEHAPEVSKEPLPKEKTEIPEDTSQTAKNAEKLTHEEAAEDKEPGSEQIDTKDKLEPESKVDAPKDLKKQDQLKPEMKPQTTEEPVVRKDETEEHGEAALDKGPSKTTITSIKVKEIIEIVTAETKSLETGISKVIKVETHSKLQEHAPEVSKEPLPQEESKIPENTSQTAKTAETLTLEEAAENKEPGSEQIDTKDKLEPESKVDAPKDLKKQDQLKSESKSQTTEEPMVRKDETEKHDETALDKEPSKTTITSIKVKEKMETVTAETKSLENGISKVIEVETHSKLQEDAPEVSKEPLPKEKTEIPEDTSQTAKNAEKLTHEEAAEDKEPGSEQIDIKDKLEPESKVDAPKDLKKQDQLKPEMKPQTTEEIKMRKDETEEHGEPTLDKGPSKTTIGKIPVEERIESVTAENKSLETEISKVIEVGTHSKLQELEPEDSKEPLPQGKSEIPEDTIQPAKTAETLTLEESAKDKEPGLKEIETKDQLEPESKVDTQKEQDQLKHEMKPQTTEKRVAREDEEEEQVRTEALTHEEAAKDEERGYERIETNDKLEPESKVDIQRDLKGQDELKPEVEPQTTEHLVAREDEKEEQVRTEQDEEPTKTTKSKIPAEKKNESVTAETKSLETEIVKVIEVETHSKIQEHEPEDSKQPLLIEKSVIPEDTTQPAKTAETLTLEEAAKDKTPGLDQIDTKDKLEPESKVDAQEDLIKQDQLKSELKSQTREGPVVRKDETEEHNETALDKEQSKTTITSIKVEEKIESVSAETKSLETEISKVIEVETHSKLQEHEPEDSKKPHPQEKSKIPGDDIQPAVTAETLTIEEAAKDEEPGWEQIETKERLEPESKFDTQKDLKEQEQLKPKVKPQTTEKPVAREDEKEEQVRTEQDEEPSKTTITSIQVEEKIESVTVETKSLKTEISKVIEVETHSKLQEHEPEDSKEPHPQEKSEISEDTIQPAKTAETLTLQEAAEDKEQGSEQIETKDELEHESKVDTQKEQNELKPEVEPQTKEKPVAREDEKEERVRTEQDEEPTKTTIGKIPVEKIIESVTAETKSLETGISKLIEVETHSKLQEYEPEDSKEPLPQEKPKIPEDAIQPTVTAETLTLEEAAKDEEPVLKQIETKDKLEPESKVDIQSYLKGQDELKPEVEPQTKEKPVAREDEKEERVRTEQDEEPTKTTIGKIPVEKIIESVTAETKSLETEISKVIEVETHSKLQEYEPEDSKEPLPQEKSGIPEDTIQPAKTAETLTLEEAAKDKEPGLEQIETKDKLEPESKVDTRKDLKEQDELKPEVKPQTSEGPEARKDETEVQDETDLHGEPTKTTLSIIPVEKKLENVTAETKILETDISKVIEVETHSKVLEHELEDSKEPLPQHESKIPKDTIQPAKSAETLTLEEAAKDKEPGLEQIETKDKLEPESKVDTQKEQDELKPEVEPQTKEKPVARKDETEGHDETALDEEQTENTKSEIPVEKKLQSVTAETKILETEISKVIEVETHSKLQEHEPQDSKEPLPQAKSVIPKDTIQPAKTAETLTLEEAAKDKEPGSEQIETKDKLEPESKVDTQKDMKEQDELKPKVEPQTKEKPVAREDEKEERVRTETHTLEEAAKNEESGLELIETKDKLEPESKVDTQKDKKEQDELKPKVEPHSKLQKHESEDATEPLPQEKSEIREDTIQPAKAAETLTLEEAAKDKEPGLEQIETKDKLEPESKVDTRKDLKQQDELKPEVKPQTSEGPEAHKDETELHEEPTKTTLSIIPVEKKLENVTADTKSLETDISKVIEVETHSKVVEHELEDSKEPLPQQESKIEKDTIQPANSAETLTLEEAAMDKEPGLEQIETKDKLEPESKVDTQKEQDELKPEVEPQTKEKPVAREDEKEEQVRTETLTPEEAAKDKEPGLEQIETKDKLEPESKIETQRERAR